jgi:hypothetical protein
VTILRAPNWANVPNNTRAPSTDQRTLAAIPGLDSTYWEIYAGNWAQIETDPVKGKMLHFRMAANGGNRCEQVVTTPAFGVGSTCWFGFDFKASSFPSTHWNIAFQFKNDGTGSPPFSFQAQSNEAGTGLHAYSASGLQNYVLHANHTIWHRVVFGFAPAQRAPNAIVEAWIDGNMIFRDTDWRSRNGSSDAPVMNGGTIYDQRTSARLKFGIYGPATTVEKHHYFANMVVATTRAEVMGSGSTPTPTRSASVPSVGDGTVTLNLGTTSGTIAGDTRQLYRADSTQTTGSAFSPFTTVASAIPLATTTYQDTGLVNGRTYYYRQGVGQTGNFGSFGGPNDFVSATPVAATAVLQLSTIPSQTATAGGSNPADTNFTVTNIGSVSGNAGFAVSDNASWLSLSVSGSASGTYARQFTASSHWIKMSIDGFGGNEPNSIAAIVRKNTDVDCVVGGMAVNSTTAARNLRTGLNTGWSVAYSDIAGTTGLDGPTGATVPLNEWVLMVVSRTSATPGSVVASLYRFSNQTWTHSGATNLTRSAASADHFAIGAPVANGSPSLWFRGDIAVFGVTGVVLTQAQKEGLVSSGLSTLALWTSNGFTSGNSAKVFILDQSSTATAVTDAVGTSTQTTLSGTSVYSGGSVPFVRTAGGGGTTGTAAVAPGTSVIQSYNISGLTAGTYNATVTVNPDEVGQPDITGTSTLVVNASGSTTSVRDFDGVDDTLVVSQGSVDLTGAWTMLVGCRKDADSVWCPLMMVENAAGTGAQFGMFIADTNPGRPGLVWNGTTSNALASLSGTNIQQADGWVILAFTKTSGSVSPRGHVYKSGVWTHANMTDVVANGTTVTGGRIRFGSFLGANFHNGKLGWAYIWDGTALSDTQLETLDGGTKETYLALAGGPTAGWEFNQTSTATAVADLVGNADQTALTGTTATTSDTPAASIYVFAQEQTGGIPGPPSNLVVSSVTSGGGANLTWTASVGPSLHVTEPYVIEVSTDLASWTQNSTSTTTSKTVSGLTVGVTNYIRVRAKNTNSQLSDPALAVPEYGEATPVANLTALTGVTAAVVPGGITMTWTPAPSTQGVLGYRIYVRVPPAAYGVTPAFDGEGDLLPSGKLQATVLLDPGTYAVTVRSYR